MPTAMAPLLRSMLILPTLLGSYALAAAQAPGLRWATLTRMAAVSSAICRIETASRTTATTPRAAIR